MIQLVPSPKRRRRQRRRRPKGEQHPVREPLAAKGKIPMELWHRLPEDEGKWCHHFCFIIFLSCEKTNNKIKTYVTPRGDGALVNVFDGDGKSVTNAISRVDGTESSFTQNVTDVIRPSECLAVH